MHQPTIPIFGKKVLEKANDNKIYNYMSEITNFSNTNSIILVQLKLDYITFTIYCRDKPIVLKPLIDEVKSRSISSSNYWIYQKPNSSSNPWTKQTINYNKIVTCDFEYNNIIHKLVFMVCWGKRFMPLLIRLHDPTREVLEMFNGYLYDMNQQQAHNHIHSIEFTSDFYCDDPIGLHQSLSTFGNMKWGGNKCMSHRFAPTTTYPNNIRLAKSRGARCYQKKIDGDPVARHEILLKRQFLKNRGVWNIDNVLEMKSMMLRDAFQFNYFNYPKYITRLTREGHSPQEILTMVKVIHKHIHDYGIKSANIKAKDIVGEQCKSYHFKRDHTFTDKYFDKLDKYSFLDKDSFFMDSSMFSIPAKYRYDVVERDLTALVKGL